MFFPRLHKSDIRREKTDVESQSIRTRCALRSCTGPDQISLRRGYRDPRSGRQALPFLIAICIFIRAPTRYTQVGRDDRGGTGEQKGHKQAHRSRTRQITGYRANPGIMGTRAVHDMIRLIIEPMGFYLASLP